MGRRWVGGGGGSTAHSKVSLVLCIIKTLITRVTAGSCKYWREGDCQPFLRKQSIPKRYIISTVIERCNEDKRTSTPNRIEVSGTDATLSNRADVSEAAAGSSRLQLCAV
jgi:hypothetical protein